MKTLKDCLVMEIEILVEKLNLITNLLFEDIKDHGIMKTLQKSILCTEILIPVYIELGNLKKGKYDLQRYGCSAMHVTDINQIKSFLFMRKSRKIKFSINLRKGLFSYVLIKDDKIIGDIWYIADSGRITQSFSDLKMLNLSLKDKEVYAFDLFISREERGKDLATVFMFNFLLKLKEEGYTKCYGFYRSDNIPAMWIHRLIGYKELSPVIIHRIFHYLVLHKK